MSLLVYYVVNGGDGVEVDGPGVQGQPIRGIADAGLQCVVSDFREGDEAPKQTLRQAALEFHHILQQGLKRSAIIPFRFPMIFADAAAVAGHLREHAEEYEKALSRLRGMVQMEITFTATEPEVVPDASGAAYLRSRQSQHATLRLAASGVRAAAGDLVGNWREHDVRDGLRGFFLVRSADVAQFQDRIRGAALPPGIRLKVSGPWPATQFLKEDDGR